MIPVEFDQGSFLLLIIWSAVIGFFLGAVYDVFRIRRISFSPQMRSKTRTAKPGESSSGKKQGISRIRLFIRKNIEVIDFVLIFFEDVLFMTFSAVVLSLLTYKLNSGKIRWFIPAFALGGFAVYYFTVGRLVKKCAESIIRFIRLAFMWILKITVAPVVRIIRAAVLRLRSRLKYKQLVRYTEAREKSILLLAGAGFLENERSVSSVKKLRRRKNATDDNSAAD